MWRDLARLLLLRPLAERPSRTLATLLGVACGVALWTTTTLLRRTTVDHFAESVAALAGKATLTVEGGDDGFPEETLDIVEKVDGVARVAPLVVTRARLEGGAEHGLVVLGMDLLREGAVRAHAIEGDVDDPLELLADADAVLVPRSLAKERGLVRGARMTVTSPAGPRALVVRGIVDDEPSTRAFGGRVVFMDIDAARVTFGREARTDRLDVLATKGVGPEELAGRLAVAVPALRVERPGAESAAFRAMIASYDRVLAELSRLSLVVAVLLAGAALRFTVAERRAEIGVLRAIGATRRAVVSAFVAQAACIGLGGGALGLGAGRVLAGVIVVDVTRATGAFWRSDGIVALDPTALHTDARTATCALLCGLLAAIAGAIVPAIRAASIQPVAALAPKGVPLPPPSKAAASSTFALGFLLLGWAVVPGLAWDALPALVRDGSLVVAVLGAAIVAPAFARLVARSVTWVLLRTPLGRLGAVAVAARSLAQATRGEGSGAVTVALVVVLLGSASQATLRASLAKATSRMLAADVWVSADGASPTTRSPTLASERAEAIAAVPGASDVRALRVADVRVGDTTVVLKAWDRPPPGHSPFVVEEGDGEAVFGSAPAALVSAAFAQHFHRRIGDAVTLTSPSGPQTFRIAGTVVDFSSPVGTIYVDRARYRDAWHDERVTAFFVDANGVSGVELRDRIDAAAPGVVVRDTVAMRALADRSVDDGFAYASAMHGSSLFVSLFALVASVLSGILERRRELGTLRALGMSGRALGAMIVVETSVLALGSACAALVVGEYLARVWLGVSLARDIGWPTAVTMPVGGIVGTLVAGVLAGALAGAAGAWRTARVRPASALSG